MNYRTILILIATLFITACQDDNPELLESLLFPEKVSPKITFITPTANGSFLANSIVLVEAKITDVDGMLTKVSLSLNGQIIKQITCNTSNYILKDTILTNQIALGNHNLSINAKDNDGATSKSSINFSINTNLTTLVSQMNDLSDWGVRSQDFETGYNDQFAADDFIVPANQNWTITEMAVDGFYQNHTYTSTCNVNVIIYNDNGYGQPGTQKKYFSNITAQDYNGDLKIQFSEGILLNPGTYWICVQNILNYTANQKSWYWRQAKTNSSQAFYWRDGTGNWQYGPSVFTNDQNSHNLAFSLTGFSGGKNE